MVLPRSSLHHANQNAHKCSVGKLALLSLLVLGASFVHILLWSSISSNSTQLSSLNIHDSYERNKRRNSRIIYTNNPLPRNGGILRSETKRHISNYDRQQDVHRYRVPSDKPRVFYLSSSPQTTTRRVTNQSVTPLSTFYNTNNTNSAASYIWDFEVPYHDECTFMESWQSTFLSYVQYPSSSGTNFTDTTIDSRFLENGMARTTTRRKCRVENAQF